MVILSRGDAKEILKYLVEPSEKAQLPSTEGGQAGVDGIS